MRLGVSGASGFVGRSLCAYAEQQGMMVTPLNRATIGNLASQGPAIELPPLDALVHLAALTHSTPVGADGTLRRYRNMNVRGTERLLNASLEAGIRHFVFVSSVKVNGEATADGCPFTEQDEPRPEDAYGRSKLEAERVVREFCDAHEIEWTIIRPPLVYGVGATANFAALRRLALSPLPLPLAGFGAPRSFIFVENLADLICETLKNPAARRQVYLVSDGQDATVAELVAMMRQCLGRSSKFFSIPAWMWESLSRIPPISRRLRKIGNGLQIKPEHAVKTLGWVAPYTLAEGISLSLGHVEDPTRPRKLS